MVFASFSRRARNASRRRFRSRLSVLAFMTKAMASPMTPRTTAAIQATIPSIAISPRVLTLLPAHAVCRTWRRECSTPSAGPRSYKTCSPSEESAMPSQSKLDGCINRYGHQIRTVVPQRQSRFGIAEIVALRARMLLCTCATCCCDQLVKLRACVFRHSACFLSACST